jgi:hypothetical protein
MATTFEELLRLADDTQSLVRELRRRLEPWDRGEHMTPTMRGAVEDAAQEITRIVSPKTLEIRPKDATEDEWNAPVVSMLRSRLESLRFAAAQRPADTDDWFRELKLACKEFEQSYTDFNVRIER